MQPYTLHRERKPYVVQPEAAGNGCPAEDNPKQPQPIGDRNGGMLLDIMASVGISSVSFCLNDIIPLLVCSQVNVEKSQVRKVVQECWKLTPASNSLSYTTYQYDYNRECRYSPVRRIGRYYLVSKEQLETL